MTYKLYYANKSASMGIRAILEELQVPYQLIDSTTDRSIPRPVEQLAVNPNGWLPVIEWDSGAMYEAAAITIFLCDRHSEAGLAPKPDSTERGIYLQTLVYFSNSIQNAFQLTYYPDRFADTDEHEASAQKRGVRRLRETWKIVDDQIGSNQWILGEQFSAADIYLFMLTTWLRKYLDHPDLDEFPNVKRIAEKVQLRPSIQMIYQSWIANPEY